LTGKGWHGVEKVLDKRFEQPRNLSHNLSHKSSYAGKHLGKLLTSQAEGVAQALTQGVAQGATEASGFCFCTSRQAVKRQPVLSRKLLQQASSYGGHRQQSTAEAAELLD
jgi:hypothetical protein